MMSFNHFYLLCYAMAQECKKIQNQIINIYFKDMINNLYLNFLKNINFNL